MPQSDKPDPNPRYDVVVYKGFAKDLAKLPTKDQRRVASALSELEHDPRPQGVLKLQGEEDLYRIRVGDYRVIYQIRDQRLLVLVVKLANRKDAY
jgi:mRNA interferase RelE/StbE